MKLFQMIMALLAFLALFATSASAAVTLPASLDISTAESVFNILIVALAAIWAMMKGKSMLGR